MARNKRSKIIMGVAVMLMIVALVVAIVIDQIAKRNRENVGLSSELARAKTYNRVEEGEEAVEGTENVKFDAFFLRDLEGNGYATGVRGTCKEIGKEDTLYMEINVQTAGYLKDAKITIDGKNFYLQTALPKDEQLANSYIGNNIKEIRFNNLTNGTQKLLTGIVRSGDYSYSSTINDAIASNINNYSREDNKIILTGTYVGEDGTEIEIRKEVPFTMDWYGTTKASIYSTTQNKYIGSCINEEEGTLNLEFTVYTEEIDKKLILKTNHTEGEIPELNGYAPILVTYTGTNATFNYDSTTRRFTIDRTSTVGEDGSIISSLSSSNSYSIKITYPLEAYQTLEAKTVQLQIPVNTYYEGYNNQNDEFTNPYKSNIAKTTIVSNYNNYQGSITNFYIEVGKQGYSPNYRNLISKQKPLKIYNGKSEGEKDDIYTVQWGVYIGTNVELGNIVMKENKDGEKQETDQFIKTNGEIESAEDVITNVGIYFSGADTVLGSNGEIKIYDEDTNNLLVTFTKNNWNKYTSSNPYKYETPVKHIRIETSKVINNGVFLDVYNIKEIDDEAITTKYEREEFDKLQYIKSTLVGHIANRYIQTKESQAYYEVPISIATIGISKKTISTQTTEKRVNITIKAEAKENQNQVKWKNGTFLIKFPTELIDVQINSISINNGSVKIDSYEVAEQDGQIFIKIVTKNITSQDYTITIDADLSPDPRIATTTRSIELYATNENETNYYYQEADIYDINNNLNTIEKVNHTTTSISMVSPNLLLTNQIATNYDEKGGIIISPQIADIKPKYAVVDQEQQEEQTAEIGIQLRNNYASTISEIQILGKIPFEGNTYVISGNKLGSTFTTKMIKTGIQVPEELREIVKVYYSENESADKDLNKAENNWKTAEQVESWDNIKTFLIDLGDYVMPTGKEFIFNYTVKIPNGLAFNKVSYSHHGVYFCLDTEQGKYRTQTEPNRLGFRIAEKYNIEIQKYQKGREKIVPGATYSITEIIQNEDGTEEKGQIKTATTNEEGKLRIGNLYVGQIYEIKETQTPGDYELNLDAIRFTSNIDEHRILTVNKIEGTTREEIAATKEEGENYKVLVKVEDEVKATLKITKKEKDTDKKLKSVKYVITGYNLLTTGQALTTDANGEASIKGLSIGQEYVLREVKAEGYYLGEAVTFKITNNNGAYGTEIIGGTVKDYNMIEENHIPQLSITLENEKIPTYDLEITKIKRTTDVQMSDKEGEESSTEEQVTYLEGARFKLYKNNELIGEYITNDKGKIVISNLYQYIEEKDENATYTLKEVIAPEGYSKVKDIKFKVQEDEGLKFINIDEKQSKYTAEGNTVKLIIEDSPLFKLIKKDGETGKVLSNIKFVIYNIDDGEKPATNSKGEILGTKELINGKEYYTLLTDSNGEITVDLPEGLYKAVEVEVPDKYDKSNSSHYFSIGSSSKGKEILVAKWTKTVGDEINCIIETSDGGYLIGGYFKSPSIDLGNGEVLNNNGSRPYSDGLIIKYSESGEAEWGKAVGGSDGEQITCIIETRDGGYIVGGYFYSSRIDLGNGEVLSNYDTRGYSDGMIIKYDSEGNVEWGKAVGGSDGDYIRCITDTQDEGYIVGGYFNSSSIDLGNGKVLNNNRTSYLDGMIIKYGVDGEVEWGKAVGGSDGEQITCIIETRDGGYIVGGYFYSSRIDLGNGEVLSNYDTRGYSDGMIIKYDSEGNVEWGKAVGGSSSDQIICIIETREGGYLVGGNFRSEHIFLENGINLYNTSDSDPYGGEKYYNGMLIKYNNNGEAEWGKVVGGSSSDYINCIIETREGGYLVGGYFNSSSIDLGNGKVLNNNRTSYLDGMIIKYGVDGEVEWGKVVGGDQGDQITSVLETIDGGYVVGGAFKNVKLENGIELNGEISIIKYSTMVMPDIKIENAKSIGGNSRDYINCIVETSDGGYLTSGYFKSPSIDLGNGVVLNSKDNNINYADGMIIKYSESGEVEWGKVVGGSSDDSINRIIETRDGGYLVGGYFASSNIDLENGVVLKNNGSTNYYDGMIVKYDSEGNVEWGKTIGGDNTDQITCVVEIQDGGYVVGGNFYSQSINLENGVVLNNHNINNSSDGMIIKYDEQGNLEWGKTIGGDNTDQITCVVETQDGGYVVGGFFYGNSIDLGNGVVLNKTLSSMNGMIIKYKANGEAEWGKVVGENSMEQITCITGTSDGGYVVGGYFISNSIDLGNGVVLNNNSISSFYGDGMIIKYNSEGNIEWGKVIGESYTERINCIVETRDGGYIVGGYFNGNSIETEINHGGYDGIIIKCDTYGNTEWIKAIGGSRNDYINCIIETQDGKYAVGGYFESSSIDLGNREELNNSGYCNGMLLEVTGKMETPEIQELVIENVRKEFKITTKVEEIDGVKGGTISGEGKIAYEKVKYGDSSTKEIIMIPNKDYEIMGITVNGKEYPFIANEDGTYTMPQFENMVENKHIVVTFAMKDNKITINKVDRRTREPLAGVRFRLDQIEERTEPENVIGELTNNGQTYIEIDKTNEIADVLGKLTNNGTYYFVEQEGKYIPTNSKTYQTANGGTTGKHNTIANSYIEIDLSNKEGKYVVCINAEVSSESADRGYATITETTIAPAYNSTNGQFIYISGTQGAKEYTSAILEGGKTYYLHLGYRKNGSVDTGKDQIIFNSIKVYGTTSTTYNFVSTEGKYESNNQRQDNTVANSYIPIDLRSYKGKYNLIVNAQVSSQNGNDIGYVTITENTDRPAYSSSTGRLIYISGEQEAKDYTTVLEGGKQYYLHLGYYKNASTSTGDDKFTINNIEVKLNDSELYHTEVETNSQGQAITQIPFGKYSITEIKAPEGYNILAEPLIIEFRANGEHEFTIENQKSAKVKVNHYKAIKNEDGTYTYTEEKVAESQILEGKVEEDYTSIPHLDLSQYKLIKNENGEYAIPENATGKFAEEQIEVIYYYEEKQIPLKVHHYIEGTEEKVPLKDGTEAEDIVKGGKENEEYTTEAISGEKLSEEYELIEIPENANGTYTGDEVIVTYYYRRKAKVITHHYLEGTEEKITIEGVEVEDEIQTGKIGDTFTTKVYENLPEYYENTSSSEITSGRYTEETIEVIYYYKLKEYNYRVEYYYNDQKDEEATEKGKEEYGKEIVGYVSKPKEGYKFKKEENVPLKITENEENNVIKIYYVTDNISYTVNYLEEDTEEELHEPKIVENQEFGATITTSSEIIDIEGYEYSSIDRDKLTIGIDETKNAINIYYIKRSDLKYTVNYLEKDTNEILHEAKTVENQVFGGIITSSTEVIEIPGYKYDSVDKESITIQVDETQNIINIYYTIRTDIKYKVEYYYNGIQDEEETEEYEGTYKEAIENYEDKIKEGYILVEVVGIPLIIEAEEEKNIIKVYYAKETTATVKYIDKTTNEIIEERTEKGYVGKEFVTEAKDFENYVLVEEPEEKTVIMEEDEVIVRYYYVHVSSGVIEKHIDMNTDEILYNTTHEGNEGDEYTTKPKEFKGYSLVEEKYPENAEGKMKREVITVNYYYKKKEAATVIIKYIDKETNEEIKEKIVIEGYEGDEYKTERKELEGYEFVEVVGEQEGTMKEEKEIIYYYQKVKEPEIPGEGGADIEEPTEPKDPTATDKEIPSAGLTKEQIAIIVVTTMTAITGILVIVGIKGIKLDKKH